MACSLIIIGYDENNIVPSAAIDDLAVKGIATKCDNCEHGKSVSVVPRTPPPGYDVTRSATFPPKPAETYVLQFADGADADNWVDTYQAYLVGKTMIQVYPAV